MILLDANVLLLDLKYTTDINYPTNRAFLDAVDRAGVDRGLVHHALLEVVGKLSYGTPTALIPRLLVDVPRAYRLAVVPTPAGYPDYAGLLVDEVVDEIGRKMSLGDAVQAAQIRKYAATATTLITWNAKHFVGRLAIPVLTPAEWLNQHHQGTTP